MEPANQSFESRDFGWLVAVSFVFLALMVFALWREFHPPWRPVQARFRVALEKYGGTEHARTFTPGIKQIWVAKIHLVDRCTTCHLGYEWSSILPASLPQPLAPHPDLPYMDKHPFQDFGCTTCHGGQGWATSKDAAHGDKNWNDPMLSSTIASRYGLQQGDLIQMRCNFCHRHDVATPGMEQINLGKKLYKENRCRLCHSVEGHGGTKAPELTYFGDRNPELVDFSHVSGAHTVFNWTYEHLMVPDKISPKTTMPTFGFKPEEARALTLVLLSWRREEFPPEYIPPPIEQPPAAPNSSR
jgi:cytochrome c2